ncbi:MULTISPECIES: hypothetical protein [unclassified Brenneria]|uniref:hypothetical protein n=1 Tax=unclassified Brenneria TaxID=2634434 RepID=UPI001555C472|nr:hypothetical protein [Brenneria sp. hezel4-2-4]MEE3649475.1 hypothetical protein [Brenneria sp. HEZEL_4_2_4]NPC99431.1 hypothetical protein [Brenneria sp. hezel4-2-4]
MDNSAGYVGDIKEIDNYLEKWCSAFLPKNYDNKYIVKVLLCDGAGFSNEEIYFSYFMYCWRILRVNLLDKGNATLSMLPYTYSRMKENNIYLDVNLFKERPNSALFYIVLSLMEFFSRSDVTRSLGAIDGSLYAVGKVKSLLGKIDEITVELNQTQYHCLSSLEYSIPYKLKSGMVDDFNSELSAIRMNIDNIKKNEVWVKINDFINMNLTVDEELANQDKLLKDVDGKIGKLKEYNSNLNFALLSDAFNKIGKKKQKELFYSYVRFFIPTLFMVLIPLVSIFFRYDKGDPALKDVFIFGPLLTLEILLFYFMRLFYGELKNIKSQLLQIDMRLSLCEFIHDYVEKRDGSEKTDSAWKAFESLIFSPIQANEDKIPAVLDGVETIAELAGKIIAAKK